LSLDVENRRLHVDISDEEMGEPRFSKLEKSFRAAQKVATSNLFHDHVQVPDTGRRFDFLKKLSWCCGAKDSH